MLHWTPCYYQEIKQGKVNPLYFLSGHHLLTITLCLSVLFRWEVCSSLKLSLFPFLLLLYYSLIFAAFLFLIVFLFIILELFHRYCFQKYTSPGIYTILSIETQSVTQLTPVFHMHQRTLEVQSILMRLDILSRYVSSRLFFSGWATKKTYLLASHHLPLESSEPDS